MKIKIIYLSKCRQRGYGGHVINFGKWRVARDTVWELRGARNPAWKLEGHVMQVTYWC